MSEITRFRSADRATVESTWSRFAPSAKLHRVDPSRLRFDWRSAALPPMSIIEYRLSAEVTSSVQPDGQLFACGVLAPGGRVRSGRRDLDPTQPWITDGREIVAHWDDAADVRALVFDPVWARETARRITGDDRLSLGFTSGVPADVESGRHWLRTVARLGDEAEAVAGSAIIEAELARHALMTTLAVFPTARRDARRRSAQTRSAPDVLRRAVAYMDEHAHEPITIDDVARAVHMSTRGLQYAFRRELGIAPSEHLRRARLDGAHRDLLRAEPSDTVAGIARRWGFAHPSRFAAAYRAAYGRPPGETLRGR